MHFHKVKKPDYVDGRLKKMLFGDPMKLIALVFGIAFSTLLMSQQGGFFIGLIYRAANVIADAREATTWVMDPQAKTFEGPTNMRATKLLRVRGVEGVLCAVPLAKRIESAAARGAPPGFPLWVWSWMVGAGSRAAVAVCRHI